MRSWKGLHLLTNKITNKEHTAYYSDSQTHEENLKKETTITCKRTKILYALSNKKCLFLRPHDVINIYICLCFVVVYLFVLVCLTQLLICFRQWNDKYINFKHALIGLDIRYIFINASLMKLFESKIWYGF